MKKPILNAAFITSAISAVCVVSTAFAAPPKESGGMYVDEHGMTLYTFDKDKAGGERACTFKKDTKAGDNFKDVWHVVKP